MSEFTLNTIEEAIEDIRNGKIIIVVDDEDRENEGDFITAARNVTPEIINFMAPPMAVDSFVPPHRGPVRRVGPAAHGYR